MRWDVGNVDLSYMGVYVLILSVIRGYLDVRREQESICSCGNGFVGGGLSIVRLMKVVSGVIGKKLVN